MSIKSKKTLSEVIAGVAIIAGYLIYALSSAAPAIGDIQAWAVVILITLGIGIGVIIVTEIIFHIVLSVGVSAKEGMSGNSDKKDIENKVKQAVKSATLEDEMDKRIDSRANSIGFSIVGTALIAALIALACGAAVFAALQIIIGGCFVGSLADGISKIFFYEKGVK